MINLDEGCKWDITKVTQRRRVESYSCNSNDIYEDIHYNISVKRKMPAYHSIVIIPALGIYFDIINEFNLCKFIEEYSDHHQSTYLKCIKSYSTANQYFFIFILVVVFLTLSVFWLPPESSEKFLLSGVTLVMICILLMMISSNIPIMSDRIPLIGKLST